MYDKLNDTLSELSQIVSKSIIPYFKMTQDEINRSFEPINEMLKKMAKSLEPTTDQLSQYSDYISSIINKHRDLLNLISYNKISTDAYVSNDMTNNLRDIVNNVVNELPDDLPSEISQATETIKSVSNNKPKITIDTVIGIIQIIITIYTLLLTNNQTPPSNTYIQQSIECEKIIINQYFESHDN